MLEPTAAIAASALFPAKPMPLSVSVHDIKTLIEAFHPVIVIETVEEERVGNLLKQVSQDLHISLFEWSIAQGLARSPDSADQRWTNEYAPPGSARLQILADTEEPLDVLKHIANMPTKAVFWLKDFAKHFDEPKVVRRFRELSHDLSYNQSALVITGDGITLPPEIVHDAVQYNLRLPDTDELRDAVKQTVRSLRGRKQIQIQLGSDDIERLVAALSGMTLKQARQVVAFAAMEDGVLSAQDVQRILDRKAEVIHEEGLLDYFPPQDTVGAPSGFASELGGFTQLKRWLARAKVGFSQEARSINLPPPKGILIVGIQGCGKSLAAKAIAQAWQMPLLKLDAGRLYDKYVGESEKNFRRAIVLAESMSPTVLWIDEIEKSIGGESGSSDDGGLSRRLFGSFLTWMQEKSREVFVVATANDISKIPPELLRKGRFDEIFFVDLPDAKERSVIFRIHLMKRKQAHETLNLPALIEATDGFSGAEIEQAIITALYQALFEKKPLSTEILLTEIKSTVPLSVSRREDLHTLRAFAQGRFVSVR